MSGTDWAWYILVGLWWVGAAIGFVASMVLWRVARSEVAAIHEVGASPAMQVAARRFRRTARIRFAIETEFLLIVPIIAVAGHPPPAVGACIRQTLPPVFSLVVTASFIYVVWSSAVASVLDYRDRKMILRG